MILHPPTTLKNHETTFFLLVNVVPILFYIIIYNVFILKYTLYNASIVNDVGYVFFNVL
jgi:hypothetical protein